MEDVTMGSHQFNGSTEFEIRITSGDMNADNDMVMASVEGANSATTLFYIYIETDGWGAETGWEIADGPMVTLSPPSLQAPTATLLPRTRSTWVCPATGCYTFTLYRRLR